MPISTWCNGATRALTPFHCGLHILWHQPWYTQASTRGGNAIHEGNWMHNVLDLACKPPVWTSASWKGRLSRWILLSVAGLVGHTQAGSHLSQVPRWGTTSGLTNESANGMSCGSYGDDVFGICVSVTCDISRTVRKVSKKDTSHKLTTACNFRELLGMDWYHWKPQELDCYSLRCDLFKVPKETSGFVDTGASRVALGLPIVFGYSSWSIWICFPSSSLEWAWCNSPLWLCHTQPVAPNLCLLGSEGIQSSAQGYWW